MVETRNKYTQNGFTITLNNVVVGSQIIVVGYDRGYDLTFSSPQLSNISSLKGTDLAYGTHKFATAEASKITMTFNLNTFEGYSIVGVMYLTEA